MPSDPPPKAPTWLVLATLVWWCLGPVPLACAAAVLAAVGFFGAEGYQTGLVGVACALVAGIVTWGWLRPRDSRTWVEVVRSALLAVPGAASTTVVVLVEVPGRSLGPLGSGAVVPFEISVAGGALLACWLLACAVRLNLAEDGRGASTASATSRRALLALAVFVTLGGAGVQVAHGVWAAQEEAALESLARDGLGLELATLRPLRPAGDGSAALLEARRVFGEDELPAGMRFLNGTYPRALREAAEAPEEAAPLLFFVPDPDDPACPDDVWGAIAMIESRVATAQPSIERALSASVVRVPWRTGEFREATPYLLAVRELASGLVLRAGHAQLRGQPEAAWRDALQLARLGTLVEENVLIAYLNRLNLADRVAHVTVELLEAGPPPSAEVADKIDRALDSFDQPKSLTSIFRGDFALLLNELARKPDDLEELLLRQGPRLFWYRGEPVTRAELLLFLPKWRRDLVRGMAEIVRASAQPDPAAHAARTAARQRSPLADHFLSHLGKCYAKRDRAVADLRLTQLALALAVAVKAGELPAAPTVDVPTDPWDPAEGSLRYRKLAARKALLWSVGPDRTDDDGRAYDPPHLLTDQEGYDMVLELQLPER